jgi:hypothetical protein
MLSSQNGWKIHASVFGVSWQADGFSDERVSGTAGGLKRENRESLLLLSQDDAVDNLDLNRAGDRRENRSALAGAGALRAGAPSDCGRIDSVIRYRAAGARGRESDFDDFLQASREVIIGFLSRSFAGVTWEPA